MMTIDLWLSQHFISWCVVTMYCMNTTHAMQEATDVQPTNVDEKAEPFRFALDKAMQVYLKEHYPNGVVTVSPKLMLTCTCTNKTP